jgi:site-specific DNA recombinase
MINIKTRDELKAVLESKFSVDRKDQEEYFRYAIYARKSTDAEDKQERSLGDQLADCKDMAVRDGLRVVKVFEESMSAKEPDIRPKFREMMNELQAGKYDGVIAWHPNRLARNMKEAGEVIDLLDKQIIKDLKFVSYTHTNDASGKMLLGITFVLSKQYSDQLSDVVLRGNRRSIEDGNYINKAKHGQLRPDGNNFTLIVEAFQMRLRGVILEEIAEYLNKNGYSRTNTASGKTYTAHMQKEAVRRFMKDPIYTGIVLYGQNKPEDLVEKYGFIPAVTVEDFMTINELEKNSDVIKLAKSFRRGGTVKSDLLRDMVICVGCGDTKSTGITTKKLKGKTAKYFYYRCDTEGCEFEHSSTRAKVVRDFAVEYFKSKPFSHFEAYEHNKAEMKRVADLRMKETRDEVRLKKSELTKLEERIVDLKSAMVLEKDEQVKEYQKEDFKKTTDRIVDLTTDISRLEKKISAEKGTVLTYENFIELFDKMALDIAKDQPMARLDAMLKKVFLNFTVNKKLVVGYTLNEPFASFERLETGKVSNGAR